MNELAESELTVKEAASELGVSERTIFNYLRDGKLTARKEGKRLLISAASLKRLKIAEQPVSFDPETQLIVDRKHYEALLQDLKEMGFRIGQLETEKRFLLEDKRPWWRKLKLFGN